MSQAGSDPHAPFDSVTLTTPDGEEHDVTRLFQESPEEKQAREAFYDTGGRGESASARINTIKVGGSLSLDEKIDNFSRLTLTIADADGQVIAAGTAEVMAGFKKHVTKDAVIIERVHTAKLD